MHFAADLGGHSPEPPLEGENHSVQLKTNQSGAVNLGAPFAPKCPIMKAQKSNGAIALSTQAPESQERFLSFDEF